MVCASVPAAAVTTAVTTATTAATTTAAAAAAVIVIIVIVVPSLFSLQVGTGLRVDLGIAYVRHDRRRPNLRTSVRIGVG